MSVFITVNIIPVGIHKSTWLWAKKQYACTCIKKKSLAKTTFKLGRYYLPIDYLHKHNLEEQDKSSDIEQQPPFGDHKTQILHLSPTSESGCTEATLVINNPLYKHCVTVKKVLKQQNRYLSVNIVHEYFLFYTKLHMTKLSNRVTLIPLDEHFYEFWLLVFIWNKLFLMHFTFYIMTWQRTFAWQWVLNSNLYILNGWKVKYHPLLLHVN